MKNTVRLNKDVKEKSYNVMRESWAERIWLNLNETIKKSCDVSQKDKNRIVVAISQFPLLLGDVEILASYYHFYGTHISMPVPSEMN